VQVEQRGGGQQRHVDRGLRGDGGQLGAAAVVVHQPVAAGELVEMRQQQRQAVDAGIERLLAGALHAGGAVAQQLQGRDHARQQVNADAAASAGSTWLRVSMHSTLNAATIQHSHSSENAHSAACGRRRKEAAQRAEAQRRQQGQCSEAGQLAEQIHSARHRQGHQQFQSLVIGFARHAGDHEGGDQEHRRQPQHRTQQGRLQLPALGQRQLIEEATDADRAGRHQQQQPQQPVAQASSSV
jgi:hypothetical protein